MALFLKNDSLFYHIPKTGGTWVQRVCARLDIAKCFVGGHHSSWMHGNPLVRKSSAKPVRYSGQDLSRTRAFMFVRHPLAWYRSLYTYFKPRPHAAAGFPKCVQALRVPFPRYIEGIVSAYPDGLLTQTVRRYLEGNGKEGPPIVIGRNESLTFDLIRILRALGERVDEGVIYSAVHAKVSEPREDTECSSTIIERVLVAEHWIVDNFYSTKRLNGGGMLALPHNTYTCGGDL